MQKEDWEEKRREASKVDSELPNALGGEQLEGSGFEEEIPEPGSEWRDPQ